MWCAGILTLFPGSHQSVLHMYSDAHLGEHHTGEMGQGRAFGILLHSAHCFCCCYCAFLLNMMWVSVHSLPYVTFTFFLYWTCKEKALCKTGLMIQLTMLEKALYASQKILTLIIFILQNNGFHNGTLRHVHYCILLIFILSYPLMIPPLSCSSSHKEHFCFHVI